MRRVKSEGNPMMVKLPTDREVWKNSSEGGLAFYLLVPKKFAAKTYKDLRLACCVTGVAWPKQDVCFNHRYDKKDGIVIDAGLLIGSTGESLWSDFSGDYFQPKLEDLTDSGKQLYRTLKDIYGHVDIVTLLDT